MRASKELNVVCDMLLNNVKARFTIDFITFIAKTANCNFWFYLLLIGLYLYGDFRVLKITAELKSRVFHIDCAAI